jgi:NAD(P)-dependent dehydrogenase (short-subunit alcohol dehydrogenase family)
MSDNGAVVVVGGTRAIGLEIARHYVEAGREVVLTGQTQANVDAAVAELGHGVTGLTFDLSKPETIAPALAGVGRVQYLVVVAIDRDQNTIRDYDVARATRLIVLKLVGYAEVVHTLIDRLDDDSSIVLFGGQAKFVPYPGSTTVTTVNGGVEGLTRSLLFELKPIRVNCVHPGIVGDSPYWESRQAALDAARARTPTGRLATMADVVESTAFLLENPAMNGIELRVDGGLHAT